MLCSLFLLVLDPAGQFTDLPLSNIRKVTALVIIA